jgi:hypothetical protein
MEALRWYLCNHGFPPFSASCAKEGPLWTGWTCRQPGKAGFFRRTCTYASGGNIAQRDTLLTPVFHNPQSPKWAAVVWQGLRVPEFLDCDIHKPFFNWNRVYFKLIYNRNVKCSIVGSMSWSRKSRKSRSSENLSALRTTFGIPYRFIHVYPLTFTPSLSGKD